MFTKQVTESIEIDADSARVWAVLTASDVSWNPFIREWEGSFAVGEKTKVKLGPPNERPFTFRPRVLAVEPGRSLEWLGRTGGIPLLFDGHHRFLIEPTGEGRVRFTQSETFRGVLVPFLGSLLKKTGEGFRLMNEALRDRSQQRPAR